MTSVFIEGAEAYREALECLTRLGHDDRIPEELQDEILREVRKLRGSTVHDVMPDFTLVKEIENFCGRDGAYAFSGVFALNLHAENVALKIDRIEMLVERMPSNIPATLKEGVEWRVADTDALALALQERVWECAGSLVVPVVSRTHLCPLLPESLRPYLPKEPDRDDNQ